MSSLVGHFVSGVARANEMGGGMGDIVDKVTRAHRQCRSPTGQPSASKSVRSCRCEEPSFVSAPRDKCC
jgi:hypothetical protein